MKSEIIFLIGSVGVETVKNLMVDHYRASKQRPALGGCPTVLWGWEVQAGVGAGQAGAYLLAAGFLVVPWALTAA